MLVIEGDLIGQSMNILLWMFTWWLTSEKLVYIGISVLLSRTYVFSFKIAEGGRGVRAILTSLSWKNIVKLWSDPL